MRLQLSLVLVGLGFALTACQNQQLTSSDSEANNPFKYTKRSAVCKVTPIVKEKDGSWKTTMAVRSDDGQCEFVVKDPDSSGSFASFGMTIAPENGKTFLYNYDNRTYVRYTPTMAYAGADKFTASLIGKDAVKRTPLLVDVTVDNTGVQVAKPVVATAPVSSSKASSKKAKTTRKKTTRRSTAKKK
ncbi:unnamed protein product [Commensalibacter communis]|uniref:Lipoprotein n=1 Tax=Commensalibacter communis TaxID=2972786 RepID=A0A9W4TK56_9PROT|nr:hypothetical protein [Commensalibacter communis]CAI3926130.1 unnamed protein product [Commensalibacter communis]CAI3927089.1 unnamed protein product [Commensalibacter communis]CAI3927650.1 unnamed protein product [Commensalibacter communis]CAI3927864.1 unnamed protein product [Commensalibacter communis]CAI3934848.1 unnamed protein product [Commensalibacter communis]